LHDLIETDSLLNYVFSLPAVDYFTGS